MDDMDENDAAFDASTAENDERDATEFENNVGSSQSQLMTVR